MTRAYATAQQIGTRPSCGAPHDEHADEAADHCGQFTLTVDPGDGGEPW